MSFWISAIATLNQDWFTLLCRNRVNRTVIIVLMLISRKRFNIFRSIETVKCYINAQYLYAILSLNSKNNMKHGKVKYSFFFAPREQIGQLSYIEKIQLAPKRITKVEGNIAAKSKRYESQNVWCSLLQWHRKGSYQSTGSMQIVSLHIKEH